MILHLIPILNAFMILGSVLLLGRIISNNFRDEQEYNKVRDNRFKRMIEENDAVLVKIFETETNIIDYQTAIVKMITDLNVFVNEQQEQFHALAKADMLAARREELFRTKELKVALERLMGVALTSRQPAAPNDILAIENLTTRIKELEKILEEGDISKV